MMIDRPPSSEFPQAVLNKITGQKKIDGINVAKIGKTGSTLSILNSAEHKNVLRNGEISASSMAVWELMYSYMPKLFSPEISEKIFGPWEQLNVPPILDRENSSGVDQKSKRIYYRRSYPNEGRVIFREVASAYSEIVGYDTINLLRLWDIEEEVTPFHIQDWKPAESRAIDSAAYHLGYDVVSELLFIDESESFLTSFNKYWSEFIQINQDIVKRQDLLFAKELRSDDLSRDYKLVSSMELVRLSHELSRKIVKIYDQVVSNYPDIVWKGKPVEHILLYLVHLCQALEQRNVMWWLGVSHGHVHLSNMVSRSADAENGEADISPLVTSIIDWDQARVSSVKVLFDRTLLKKINKEEVKNLINDVSLNIHVRLAALNYLPVTHWDEKVKEFFQKHKMSLGRDFMNLISTEAIISFNDSENFIWFLDAVFEHEREQLTDWYPGFPLTLTMIQKSRHRIPPTHPLAIVSEYFEDGSHFEFERNTLNEDQLLVLFSSVYERLSDGNGVSYLPLSLSECNFGLDHVFDNGLVGSHARELIQKYLSTNFDEDNLVVENFNPLIQRIQRGDKLALSVLKKMVNKFFIESILEKDERIQHEIRISQNKLLWRLLESEGVTQGLNLIDFSAITKEQAMSIYEKIKKTVVDARYFEDKDELRQKTIQEINGMLEKIEREAT